MRFFLTINEFVFVTTRFKALKTRVFWLNLPNCRGFCKEIELRVCCFCVIL